MPTIVIGHGFLEVSSSFPTIEPSADLASWARSDAAATLVSLEIRPSADRAVVVLTHIGDGARHSAHLLGRESNTDGCVP